MSSELHAQYPDGITSVHVEGRHARARMALPVSLLVLAAVVAIAVSGLVGGGETRPRVVETPDARLEVTFPHVLRNGMLFEVRLDVQAKRGLSDVTIGLPPSLWREITINTVVPEPVEERFVDGSYHLSYGAMTAGERLELKVDGQLNPSLVGLNHGEIGLLDGERRIASLPISLNVLP